MSPALLAAAAPSGEASPIALVVILCLLVAVVLLVRSMNRHLRRVPASFDRPPGEPPAEPTDPGEPDRSR